MTMRGSLVISVIAALVPTVSLAQVPTGKEALHYRVDEGIFTLQEGKVIDITDRKFLLSLPKQDRTSSEIQREMVRLVFNGATSNGVGVQTGSRIDLLYHAKYSSIGDRFKDISVCFLDVLDVAIPKGAPITVKFRLDCK